MSVSGAQVGLRRGRALERPSRRWLVRVRCVGCTGLAVAAAKAIAIKVVQAFLIAVLAPTAACAGQPRLPVIGPAPAFVLVDQRGQAVSLTGLRGKVLALSFIFTTCSDSCPIVTAKMADMQRRLGKDFGPRVRFVSISVDPLTDTPQRLRAYASTFGADVPGWSFVTGTPAQIDEIVRGFGAYARRGGNGAVDHLTLTSLIDAEGRLRVQYLGYRFQTSEMLADLKELLDE
jgi:protein SCO1/2